MKKIFALILALGMCLPLIACGQKETMDKSAAQSASAAVSSASAAEPEEATEGSSDVDSIDYVTENGEVKYVGVELPEEGLLNEGEEAVLVEFEYTNFKSSPSSMQEDFCITYYQNSVECDMVYGWYGDSDQSKLIDNFNNSVLQNGTLKFAQGVIVTDDNPITIVVKEQLADDYQMMTVEIANLSEQAAQAEEEAAAANEAEAAEVAALLPSSWMNEDEAGSTVFLFDDVSYTATFVVGGETTTLAGSWDVDPAEKRVVAHYTADNKDYKIYLPYDYEDGTLTLYKNTDRAGTFTRQ